MQWLIISLRTLCNNVQNYYALLRHTPHTLSINPTPGEAVGNSALTKSCINFGGTSEKEANEYVYLNKVFNPTERTRLIISVFLTAM